MNLLPSNKIKAMASAFLALACLFVCVPSHAQQNDSQLVARGLEGTWTVTVSPTPNGPQFTPILALVSFAAGVLPGQGTLTETEDDAFSVTAGLLSPGHGVWSRTTSDQYAYTFLLHIFDPSGNLAGIETNSATVKIDASGKTFAGRAHFVAVSPAGVLLYSGNALLSAVRLQVQPLD